MILNKASNGQSSSNIEPDFLIYSERKGGKEL